ncbi:MAG: thioredoxin domain-containing protein [Candidatus Lambdaproteobacteria bacterium]|nr:thioredoxin domain-containing protein [Candidatus Lambdaproteobacteria bacterium]
MALVALTVWAAPMPVAAQSVAPPSQQAIPSGQVLPPSTPEERIEALTARVQELEAQHTKLENQILELTDRLNVLLGAPERQDVFVIPLGESPIRGNPQAPVTLTVFGDYQSGYTARAQAVVQLLLEEFSNQLRYVYKHFPLSARNAQANEAALSAIAAQRQNKFWEMHDALFRNSRRLEPNLYLVLAEQNGLDLLQFQSDRNSLWTLERLSEDEKLGAKLGVADVPAFFLNGRRMSTWRHDYLKEQIRRVLAN